MCSQNPCKRPSSIKQKIYLIFMEAGHDGGRPHYGRDLSVLNLGPGAHCINIIYQVESIRVRLASMFTKQVFQNILLLPLCSPSSSLTSSDLCRPNIGPNNLASKEHPPPSRRNILSTEYYWRIAQPAINHQNQVNLMILLNRWIWRI